MKRQHKSIWKSAAIGRLSSVGFISILLLLIVGCTQATTEPGGAPESKQVPQELVWSTNANFPASTDPASTAGTFGLAPFMLVYDSLVRQSAGGKFEPDAAESWKQISPTTLQFKLRQGLKFHNGDELTADDVKFTVERIFQDKAPVAARIPGVSIEVVDKYTVNVVTKEPDPLLLGRMAWIFVVPKNYWNTAGGAKGFMEKPIGSGPYKIESFRDKDSYVLSKTDHLFRRPTLTKITERSIPELAARVAALKTGELDLMEMNAEQLKDFQGTNVKTVTADRPMMNVFVLGAEGPTGDPRVRKALNYAVDKDTIKAKLLGGFGTNTGQLMVPGTFGYNPDVKPYPYDVAKAKALLAEAGYANGFKSKMEYITAAGTGDLALAVQEYLRAVGIELEMTPIELGVWAQKIYGQGRPPFYSFGISAEPVTDADFALSWFHGKRSQQLFYSNPKFDEIYEKSKAELDPAKREALLKQLAQIISDDPPAIFLISRVQFWAYKPDVVGFEAPSIGIPWLEPVSRK